MLNNTLFRRSSFNWIKQYAEFLNQIPKVRPKPAIRRKNRWKRRTQFPSRTINLNRHRHTNKEFV
ncbi:uncharacterized protein PGTG_20757 [Puccinia graminis f. sp. tritici CRL 75-36-700-3]|uniref:Uncharacterized protein n=1 Tax=Puccinia graminis f. sp. tritici (strain CRL 75-36-700-3 / race SCCL) TaxID=418459 RepID=H6QP44_PUCGT|nr:uncharacterized protein PGTG_20757 [Puccinia graminis f. sp. tritici CRL 75-36-700-3]EHS63174.1 hypothetical protein PGTG_20757 [Puccinia graminis f. sp. tritici CRL 75-36-700-3]